MEISCRLVSAAYDTHRRQQPGCSVSQLLNQQDNVQLNTESVQCITIAYSKVHISEISEQLSTVDPSG